MTLEIISLEESERLNDLEQVVLDYKPELIKVANALMEIRDSRLYRAEFKSFGDYCKAKFGFGKSRGYQLIEFAAQVHNVDSNSAPANEHQARQRKAKERNVGRTPGLPTDRHSVVANDHDTGVTAGETAPLSEPQDQPRIVSGAQAEDSATPAEPSPAPFDYASELVDLAEAALMKAPADQLQRLATYAVILPKKIKDAIAARKSV